MLPPDILISMKLHCISRKKLHNKYSLQSSQSHASHCSWDVFHFRAELSETARDGDYSMRWLEKRGACAAHEVKVTIAFPSLPHTLQGRRMCLRASSLSFSMTGAMRISLLCVWPSLLCVWPSPLLCHCVYSLSHRLAEGVGTPCATSIRPCSTVQTLPYKEMGSSEA